MESWRNAKAGLAVTLGLLVSLGSPGRALAQAPSDAGSSGWSAPEASDKTNPPKELPPPSQGPSVAPPPAELPALPPRVETAPPAAEPAPELGPSYAVTLDSGSASVSISIQGPGIDKPLTCSGSCTFKLFQGTYWLNIQTATRNWTKPLTVTGAQHVLIDKPNAGARGLGIAGIIVGGAIFSVSALYAYTTVVSCGPGGLEHGTAQCNALENTLPYWLVGTAAGAVMAGVGIGLFIANNQPSFEVVPAGSGARREPGTFVGIGSVDGSQSPGLTLRTSF